MTVDDTATEGLALARAGERPSGCSSSTRSTARCAGSTVDDLDGGRPGRRRSRATEVLGEGRVRRHLVPGPRADGRSVRRRGLSWSTAGRVLPGCRRRSPTSTGSSGRLSARPASTTSELEAMRVSQLSPAQARLGDHGTTTDGREPERSPQPELEAPHEPGWPPAPGVSTSGSRSPRWGSSPWPGSCSAYYQSLNLAEVQGAASPRRSRGTPSCGRRLVEHLDDRVLVHRARRRWSRSRSGSLLTRPRLRRFGPGHRGGGQLRPGAPGLRPARSSSCRCSARGCGRSIWALVLYALLPVLRNTMVGLDAVDRSVIEAGRGMGMTRWQVLTRIELPLAVPVILAGVRIAMIINIGMATLAFLIGGGGLGITISAGLKLQQDPVLDRRRRRWWRSSRSRFDWLGARGRDATCARAGSERRRRTRRRRRRPFGAGGVVAWWRCGASEDADLREVVLGDLVGRARRRRRPCALSSAILSSSSGARIASASSS